MTKTNHPCMSSLTLRPCNSGCHIPNLLIAETEHDSRPVRFKGEHCIRDFLEWLDNLTEKDTQPVPHVQEVVPTGSQVQPMKSHHDCLRL